MRYVWTLATVLILAGPARAYVGQMDSAAGVVDTMPPTALLSLDDPALTALDAVRFSVGFGEAAGTSFDADDVMLTGTLAGAATLGVSGVDPSYTVTVTMNNTEDDGSIGIQIGTGVTDLVGNAYAGGASVLYRIHNWHGFTVQPLGASIYLGGDHTFTVAASVGNGTPIYQWKFNNGSTVQNVGTNAPTYAVAGAALNQAGDYWCEVTYDGATYPSNPAALRIADHLVITVHPVGGSVYAGSAYAFSILTAGGFTPLTYQWRKDGTDIGGATLSTFTLASLALAHEGTYACAVRDAGTDSLLSSDAILIVKEALGISAHPASANVSAGGSHTLDVTVIGGYTPYTYQWYINGTAIPDATLNSLTFDPLAPGDQGSYTCMVHDSAMGVAASNAAVLRVLAIQTQPLNQNVDFGGNASFSVTVLPGSGNAPYAYQWHKNGTTIGGETLSTFSITSAQSSDDGNYACVIGQIDGDTLTSAIATLLVTANPISINAQPAGGSVYVGGSYTFMIDASGGIAPLTYQWTKGGTLPANDIAGATLTSYSLATLALVDDAEYYCVVGDSNAMPQTLVSAAARLYVRHTVTLSTQPLGQALYTGSSCMLTIGAAGGYPPLTYQWRNDGTSIAGAGLSTLALGPVTPADQGDYDCVVSDALTEVVTSAIAILQIADHISIVTNPVPRNVIEGTSVSFSVTAIGGIGPILYQWRRDGADVSGATSSLYTISSVVLADSADYACAVTDANNDETVVSSAAHLTVTPGMPVAVPAVLALLGMSIAVAGRRSLRGRK